MLILTVVALPALFFVIPPLIKRWDSSELRNILKLRKVVSLSMISPTKYLARTGKGFNVLAGIAVIIMMLLSSADVVLRAFGKPIPGTYELVGFLGIIVVSFALGFTTLEKGHIAVELLVRKLPQRVQLAIETVTNFFSFLIFGLIAYQAFIYALDIRKSGEVSLTLQMPIYPFIFGMALGFGLMCLILIADFIKALKRTLP